MTEKTCSRCRCRHPESAYRIKKNAKCKSGYYVSGVCKYCENSAQKERDKQRRLNNDTAYILKRRAAVKKYHSTEKGRSNKKKQNKKSRQRHREYYLKNSKKYYQLRLARLKKEIETISDEYVITQLQNPNRKTRYTREYLKQNPHLIEEARIRILNNRLKRKIEQLSDFGFCRGCGRKVKKSEFRTQKATNKKKQYIVRLCEKCRKAFSKKCWQAYKNKKDERHSKFKKPLV